MKFKLIESSNTDFSDVTHIITTKYTSEELKKIQDAIRHAVVGYFDNVGGDIGMWSSTAEYDDDLGRIPEDDFLAICAIMGYKIYYNKSYGYMGGPDYAIFKANSNRSSVKDWIRASEEFTEDEIDEMANTFILVSNDSIIRDYLDKIADAEEDVEIY